MIDHFKKYSNWIKNEFIKKNSKLIEVGSNDGTFLKNFNNSDISYIGFEPSYSAYKIAKKRKVKTLNEFLELPSDFVGYFIQLCVISSILNKKKAFSFFQVLSGHNLLLLFHIYQ